MGNNLLSACKNTSQPTEQNDAENEQTQKDKQEKRKLERKKVNKNKSDLNSVHAEEIIQDKARHFEEQSDQNSQQMNANDGQFSQNGDVTSAYNQESNVQLNKMRKSSHTKMSKKKSSNNFMNSSQNQQNDKYKIQKQNYNKNPQEQEAINQVEEERQLKNNNDKYFTKDDLDFYEIKYKNEKKVVPPKDKNIRIFKFFCFKRWQQGEVLGTGSFGSVILGMNIDTGEFMAVKQVHIGGYNQEDRKEVKDFQNYTNQLSMIQQHFKVQQIQSEIEALQNFSDKNIVRYIGIKKSETSINIFLEYVPGGSISSLLYRYGKFNETLIRKFTQQILKGLEYLHAHEIIHRDIKGANVLVDKDGNCKLADFGSAKKIVEEKGHNDSIRGTPYWMAPETIKQAGSGRFADIWSIGCTVIEMAIAKPPWADRSPIQAMFYIANAVEPPPIPDGLSHECKDFISKCLRINPYERYNVRQLLYHQFITGKKSMHQSIRQLALITEEATQDYQTSSPDKRKEYLTREESRGNTLFHEEYSMKDTQTEKIRAFSIKTKTQKSTKTRKSVPQQESDGDSSQDSIDAGRQKQQSSNPRQINPQPKIIQSRSNQQNHSSGKNHHNYQNEKYVNNNGKNDDESSESSSRSSSPSNRDKKANTQYSQSNTENIPIRKKQITPFSQNHKLTQSQYSKAQNQQQNDFTATISIDTQDKDTVKQESSMKQSKQLGNDDQNDGYMTPTTATNKLLDNIQTNLIQNQQQKLILQNQTQNYKNISQNNNNNNQQGQQNKYDNQYNNNNEDDKKQMPQLQKINSNNSSKQNQIEQNTKQMQIGQKQNNQKTQKTGDLNFSSSSQSDSSQANIINQSPTKSYKSQTDIKNKIQNKDVYKQDDSQKQLAYIDKCNSNYDDDDDDDQQIKFYQKPIENVVHHQGQNNSQSQLNGSTRSSRIRRDQQIEDSDTFNRDKFGRLKFSKPKSPKQLTQNSQIGTNMNNSFDMMGIDNKTNIIQTESTTKNKGIGSFKQEQAKEYSKYFGQNQKGRSDDQNSTSSIDQNLISQYMAQSHKNQNIYQPNSQNMERHVESINIDEYSESQFESYNSKQTQKSKQNMISKNY